MKKYLLILFFTILSGYSVGQGFYNHVWLLGNFYFIQDPKGRIEFDSTSYSHTVEFRKMPFLGTEATICNAQGDFLMSSNGVWIANATNDTMMNGGGLNPGAFASNWPYGIPLGCGNLFLPFPGDSSKYILFHETKLGSFAIDPTTIYNSIIDITLDGGLGGVILKNDSILTDTLSWGLSACKHANGRDWWVVCIKDGNPYAYTFLLTPNGIDTVFGQNLNFISNTYGNVSQISFSKDGNMCAFTTPINQNPSGTVLLYDFDRCTGSFSNVRNISISSSNYLFGVQFSPSGKYVYACSSSKIFQINTDSLTVDTVAFYDGFVSPPGQTCCATSFWNMYLAANGKIYITSGSSVQHIHEMNYPDSASVACDLQQHAIDLGSYLHLRAVPNHPNYNLGPVTGSVCDSLGVGISEIQHDFHFGISPNPVSNGMVKIIYILPQNQGGELTIFNITGQVVYRQQLPPWSTLQYLDVSHLRDGVYSCVLRSGAEQVVKKLVITGRK